MDEWGRRREAGLYREQLLRSRSWEKRSYLMTADELTPRPNRRRSMMSRMLDVVVGWLMSGLPDAECGISEPNLTFIVIHTTKSEYSVE